MQDSIEQNGLHCPQPTGTMDISSHPHYKLDLCTLMSDTPNLNLVIVYLMRLFKFNIKYSSTLVNVLNCLYNENLLLVFS